MYFAQALFSISVNHSQEQFEEHTGLIDVSNYPTALSMFIEAMLEKNETFINSNGDLVEWTFLGLVRFDPVSKDSCLVCLNSRLMDSVSEYTLDSLLKP